MNEKVEDGRRWGLTEPSHLFSASGMQLESKLASPVGSTHTLCTSYRATVSTHEHDALVIVSVGSFLTMK